MTIRLGHIKEICMKCKKTYNFGHLEKNISPKGKKTLGYLCKNCLRKTKNAN